MLPFFVKLIWLKLCIYFALLEYNFLNYKLGNCIYIYLLGHNLIITTLKASLTFLLFNLRPNYLKIRFVYKILTITRWDELLWIVDQHSWCLWNWYTDFYLVCLLLVVNSRYHSYSASLLFWLSEKSRSLFNKALNKIRTLFNILFTHIAQPNIINNMFFWVSR